MLTMTWSQVTAMNKSHSWKVRRGANSRVCRACGDSLNSDIRYCPGGTAVLEESIAQVPLPLEYVENPRTALS